MDMAKNDQVRSLSARLTQLANHGAMARSKTFQFFLRHFVFPPRVTGFRKGKLANHDLGDMAFEETGPTVE